MVWPEYAAVVYYSPFKQKMGRFSTAHHEPRVRCWFWWLQIQYTTQQGLASLGKVCGLLDSKYQKSLLILPNSISSCQWISISITRRSWIWQIMLNCKLSIQFVHLPFIASKDKELVKSFETIFPTIALWIWNHGLLCQLLAVTKVKKCLYYFLIVIAFHRVQAASLQQLILSFSESKPQPFIQNNSTSSKMSI